jgi:hypothetical protein
MRPIEIKCEEQVKIMKLFIGIQTKQLGCHNSHTEFEAFLFCCKNSRVSEHTYSKYKPMYFF